MLCGSRFTSEFNIHDLKTGQLVCSRDYQVIKGISWCLCVRRSVNKNNTGAQEDVIRTKDELLGFPLSISRKDNPIESERKISRCRSKRKVHFVDESSDSEIEDQDLERIHRRSRVRMNSRNGRPDVNFTSTSKTVTSYQNSSSETDDNSHLENGDSDSTMKRSNQYTRNSQPRERIRSRHMETLNSSDSEEDVKFTPRSFRSDHHQMRDKQRDESTSSSESDDPRGRPRSFRKLGGEIVKEKRRSRRSPYGQRNHSVDKNKETGLDFYLKLEEKGTEKLKQCTTNFTLDIVNKNRGMRKVRKYKYQTFFPDDVSGWKNVITWNDLTNRDNCFVDKNGYFNIEAAVIVLNTKILIEKMKPERLETIV